MTPIDTITQYIEEVKRLDKESAPGDWHEMIVYDGHTEGRMYAAGPDRNYHDTPSFQEAERLANIDQELMTLYRTSAPRLAEALEEAVNTLIAIKYNTGPLDEEDLANIHDACVDSIDQIAQILQGNDEPPSWRRRSR